MGPVIIRFSRQKDAIPADGSHRTVLHSGHFHPNRARRQYKTGVMQFSLRHSRQLTFPTLGNLGSMKPWK